MSFNARLDLWSTSENVRPPVRCGWARVDEALGTHDYFDDSSEVSP